MTRRQSAITSGIETVLYAAAAVAFVVLAAVWLVRAVLDRASSGWIGLAIIVVILSIYIIPMFYGFRQATMHANRQTEGLCPNCGYDLRASKDRCPECGTPIPTTEAKA